MPADVLPVTSAAELPTEGAIPLAFAMALIGLLLCVTGRDALGHILGFLVFENGIFGLAILATYGLPGIVEAGVFLDVLVIVLIMEAVVVQVRREHDSIHVDRARPPADSVRALVLRGASFESLQRRLHDPAAEKQADNVPVDKVPEA